MATHPRVFLPGKSMDRGAERAGLQQFMGFKESDTTRHTDMCLFGTHTKRGHGLTEGAACLGLVRGDDPERCCGEGGGRGVHVWEACKN